MSNNSDTILFISSSLTAPLSESWISLRSGGKER